MGRWHQEPIQGSGYLYTPGTQLELQSWHLAEIYQQWISAVNCIQEAQRVNQSNHPMTQNDTWIDEGGLLLHDDSTKGVEFRHRCAPIKAHHSVNNMGIQTKTPMAISNWHAVDPSIVAVNTMKPLEGAHTDTHTRGRGCDVRYTSFFF